MIKDISRSSNSIGLRTRPKGGFFAPDSEILDGVQIQGFEAGQLQVVQVTCDDENSNATMWQCDPGTLLVGLLDRGTTKLHKKGSPNQLVQPGDPFFIIGGRQGCALSWEKSLSGIAALLPYSSVFADMPEPEVDCDMLSGNAPLVAPVAAFLRGALNNQAQWQAGPVAAYALEKLAIEMVGAVFLEDQGIPASSTRPGASLYDRAMLIVTSQSSQPDLAPDRLASQLDVSTRTLQRAFLGFQGGVTQAIRTQRHRLALKLLEDPAYSSLDLSAVARHSGFSTLSQMNRSFASMGSKSPAKYRSEQSSG